MCTPEEAELSKRRPKFSSSVLRFAVAMSRLAGCKMIGSLTSRIRVSDKLASSSQHPLGKKYKYVSQVDLTKYVICSRKLNNKMILCLGDEQVIFSWHSCGPGRMCV